MSRITLSVVITGQTAGVSDIVKEVLEGSDISCVHQKTWFKKENEYSWLTLLIIEGEKKNIFETRDLLFWEIVDKISPVYFDDWEERISEKVFATETPEFFTRNSSEFGNEEISEASTDEDELINERLKKFVKVLGRQLYKAWNEPTPLLVHPNQTAGEIKAFSGANSNADALVKNSWFSYRDRTLLLNTQPYLEWILLIQDIKIIFEIPQNVFVMIYQKLDDGTLGEILDTSGFEAKCRYFVQTKLEKSQSSISPEMSTFFEKLKSDEDLSESQVAITKKAFESQSMTFKQLMKTGDLAVTDAELKECGIGEMGIRKAILSVIKATINTTSP
ncbi:hypothetical protein HK103_001892 [Boothiomyces macroporosus]|uniref:Uncharacterized protein n=1 Tax=Boothiomyces macroporosus TaxID=261099 RepID=A0AAD5UA01_9FUNG|nr:hypothetical protein HK103_001892 [Boothiomyces macroporosus]